MINLSALRSWATTILAILFLVLWRWSEHEQAVALDIAHATVQTTSQCVTSFRAWSDTLTHGHRSLEPVREQPTPEAAS